LKVKQALANKSRKLRYKMIKLLAPKLFDFQTSPRFLRPSTIFIIKQNAVAKLVGVEIGVKDGTNALSLLQTLPIKKLYLVDPYMPYYDGSTYNSEAEQKMHYETAEKFLAQFRSKTQFLLKTSEEAAKDIPDKLDFVYIDGNHEYSFVKKDMKLYYRKLRIGGTLSGHDYVGLVDVRKAVDDFAKEHGMLVESGGNDWFFKKK
jgi:hypothetical protein